MPPAFLPSTVRLALYASRWEVYTQLSRISLHRPASCARNASRYRSVAALRVQACFVLRIVIARTTSSRATVARAARVSGPWTAPCERGLHACALTLPTRSCRESARGAVYSPRGMCRRTRHATEQSARKLSVQCCVARHDNLLAARMVFAISYRCRRIQHATNTLAHSPAWRLAAQHSQRQSISAYISCGSSASAAPPRACSSTKIPLLEMQGIELSGKFSPTRRHSLIEYI